MALISTAAAAVISVAAFTGSSADTPKDLVLAQARSYPSTQGQVQAAGGNYMTTPEGCTYRRTQAPGYPARWILVVNPHHVGAAPATTKCPGMR